MARKRLLAPEHFKHAELYDLEVTTCLPVSKAYQGLWCQADRRGLFAWRPIDLRLEIFPYGFGVHQVVLSTVLARCQHCASTVLGMADVMAETLEALCGAGFIEFYEVEGRAYGRIPNFHRWQTFHVREKPDRLIPEPLTAHPPTSTARQIRSAARCQHGASTVPAPGRHGAGTPGTGTGTDTGTKELHNGGAQTRLPLPDASRADRPRAPRAQKSGSAAFPHFPVPLCQQWHTLWISRLGAVDYARFRRALGPLFTVPENDRPAGAPSNAELTAALTSYVDLAPSGAGAPFASVEKAAEKLSAIALARRQFADNPDARLSAIERILNGRPIKGAA